MHQEGGVFAKLLALHQLPGSYDPPNICWAPSLGCVVLGTHVSPVPVVRQTDEHPVWIRQG